jgi:hypothetical protein
LHPAGRIDLTFMTASRLWVAPGGALFYVAGLFLADATRNVESGCELASV